MTKIYILLFIVAVISNSISTIVETNLGKIDGRHVVNEKLSISYFAFQGIPYAKPPLGILRFQPPQQLEPWNNTLETKKDGSKCMPNIGGSEDCLFLNVFTPMLSETSNQKNQLLPVMVYIHGGAFIHGSSSIKKYGPDYLMTKNVVLVTFNYRLSVFGFLDAGIKSAPGNVGLKDQVVALKWVKENISKFGGNPNEVTIFGHSAGGSSVHYLLLSKLASGLFHRAILQSGSAINEFALQNNSVKHIQNLCDYFKCGEENITNIVAFLKNTSPEELHNAVVNISEKNSVKNLLKTAIFIPTIEKELPDAFITESSYSLLLNNKVSNPVPLMIGYVDNEALFFLKNIEKNQVDLQIYKENSNYLIPKYLFDNIDLDTKTQVVNKILKFYFDNTSVTDINSFIKYESQNIFVRGIRKSIELMKDYMDIYFYIFSYKNYENKTTKYDGVPHTGELKYIFQIEGIDEMNENDINIREKMVTLWSNFAKFGNPTPKAELLFNNIIWPKISIEKKETKYLNIDKQLTIDTDPQQDHYIFWENIFKKYSKHSLYVW